MMETMYDEYKNGMSTVKLSKKYGFNASTIGNRFRRAGYKLRSNKENSRIYNLNHSYFNNIDNEEKAYFLGFIYADGFLTLTKDGSKKVGISISTQDKHILEDFNKATDSTYPIREYEVKSSGYKIGAKYVRILITSDEMFDDLLSLGVYENKTNILEFPDKVPNHLIRHFIRGYMDGDGSIYKTKGKRCRPDYHVSFMGTDSILNGIHEHFVKKGFTKRTSNLIKRKEHHIVSNLRYGGNILTRNILDYLYEDSNVFLKRKQKRYLELCNL